MDLLLEIVKISLPAIIVGTVVVVLINKHFRNVETLKELDVKQGAAQQSLPIKFQACERLVLLMERISIENLLTRVSATGMTVQEFHMELISNVNVEFEHNLSQQLYVSDRCWQSIKEAKEEILGIINGAVQNLDPNEDSVQLINLLIQEISKREIHPSTQAIMNIKSEAKGFSK